MELTSDTKFVISILFATVLVIGGGAYLTSKKSVEPTGRVISDALTERLVREDSPRIGSNDAKVKFVEFGDFECPSCGSLHPTLKELKEKYKDQSVQFIFRHYPLPQHKNASLASEAAVEAGKQNKFWEYHDILFENQSKLEKDHLLAYAEQLGLNVQAFNFAFETHSHSELVQRDQADGSALGVRGTPTLFINNQEYTGKYSIDALSAAIDEALAK